jgi:hypothetical protein
MLISLAIEKGNAVRKGSKLSRLRQLYAEGINININFTNELRPIKAAITAAEQWKEQNAVILHQLQIRDEEDEDGSAIAAVGAAASGERTNDEHVHSDEEASAAAAGGREHKRKATDALIDAASSVNASDDAGAELKMEQETADVSFADLKALSNSASQLLADFGLVR